ncbi:hypothetical protein FACS189434_08230 [Bacteroidia bacterium]|nr:hypothetical protein FACS189434_08230 [Bacteroidia bacterium]
MNMQNLETQLEALHSLKNFIEQFSQDIYLTRQTYQNKMFGLHDAGVPLQVANNYCRDFWDRNDKILWQIIGNFKETDYPYILRQIETIEAAIKAAGSGSSAPQAANFIVENVDNKEKTTKKCAMCGKDFETTFAANQFCPKCFYEIWKNKNAFQNERER